MGTTNTLQRILDAEGRISGNQLWNESLQICEHQNCPMQLTTSIMGVAYRQHYDANDSFFESSNILNDIYDFVKYSITMAQIRICI